MRFTFAGHSHSRPFLQPPLWATREAMPRLTKVIEKKLGRERAMGEAIFGENEICIDPRQSSKDYLDTLTHEAMHLALPELNEEAITTSATFVARILWRQGYRKCDL